VKSTELIRCRFAADLPTTADRTPPTEFRIFAAGLNQSEQGPCVFDDVSSESVMREYQEHGKPTLLDFNHGTEYPFPDPEMAISAGEFTPEIRNGELWATNIKWTDRAAEYLRKGEYRLFSPCFAMDPETLRVMRIISVALTNRPALDNIEPLVAASANGKGQTMTTEDQVRKLEARVAELETENRTLRAACTAIVTMSAAMGIKSSTAVDELPGAVQAAVTFRDSVVKLTGDKNPDVALGTLSTWQTKAATADRLTLEKADLEIKALSGAIDAAIDQATKVGKVPPALKESERSAALAFGGGKPSQAGVDWLVGRFKAMSPVVKTDGNGEKQTEGGAEVVTLSAIEVEAAKRHGITLERAIDAKKRLNYGGPARE